MSGDWIPPLLYILAGLPLIVVLLIPSKWL